jgi:hypothetical protein
MSSKSDDELKPRRKRSVTPSVVKDADGGPQPKAKRGKAAKAILAEIDDDANDEEPPSKTEKKSRTKATPHQTLTQRDELPKLWNAEKHEDTSYSTLFVVVDHQWFRSIRAHPK